MFSQFEKDNSLRKEVRNELNANFPINNKDKLDKSLAFWNNNYRFLLKANVIILTGINNDSICAVEMIDIMKQLIKIELINNLKSFLPLSNKAFTYMEFSDDISAERFRKLSVRIADTKIFFINIEPPAMFINLFIDKLPASILAEYLPDILQQYGEIISINPTKMNLLNGNKCNTGSNKVCFRLNKTSTVNDIPYFAKIENIRIYIHIPTRPKRCFRCTAKDHLVSGCTFRYFNTCHSYKDPLHSCYLSYASKVTQSRDLWHAALMKAQEECFQSELGLLHDSEQGVLSEIMEQKGHNGDGMEMDGIVVSSEPVISVSIEKGDSVSEDNSLPASPAECSVGKIIENEIVNPCSSAQMEEDIGHEGPSSSGDSGYATKSRYPGLLPRAFLVPWPMHSPDAFFPTERSPFQSEEEPFFRPNEILLFEPVVFKKPGGDYFSDASRIDTNEVPSDTTTDQTNIAHNFKIFLGK